VGAVHSLLNYISLGHLKRGHCKDLWAGFLKGRLTSARRLSSFNGCPPGVRLEAVHRDPLLLGPNRQQETFGLLLDH
jgi:hypothetical protein